MPLILSMKQGDDFYVGSKQMVVGEIRGDEDFTVYVDGIGDFEISGDMQTEVLPDVMLSAGNRAHPGTIRVSIEAPPDILILRGDKVRQVE